MICFLKLKSMKLITAISAFLVFFSSCSIIRPGEVGVKTRFGKLSAPKSSGIIAYNPFVARVIKLPTRTVNLEMLINLPSKEGLTIKAEISILYKIKPDMARKIIAEIGYDYEKIINAVFRSASANVTSNHFAKEMHSGERDRIEREIAESMNAILGEKGFIIEAVLLKSITLPEGLAKAIEEKLEAEQQAQRMEFVLLQERKEAERKKIEAQGTRDAQLILSEGLTDQILRLRYIEALMELSKSNNAKIIIPNGNSNPLILPGNN